MEERFQTESQKERRYAEYFGFVEKKPVEQKITIQDILDQLTQTWDQRADALKPKLTVQPSVVIQKPVESPRKLNKDQKRRQRMIEQIEETRRVFEEELRRNRRRRRKEKGEQVSQDSQQQKEKQEKIDYSKDDGIKYFPVVIDPFQQSEFQPRQKRQRVKESEGALLGIDEEQKKRVRKQMDKNERKKSKLYQKYKNQSKIKKQKEQQKRQALIAEENEKKQRLRNQNPHYQFRQKINQKMKQKSQREALFSKQPDQHIVSLKNDEIYSQKQKHSQKEYQKINQAEIQLPKKIINRKMEIQDDEINNDQYIEGLRETSEEMKESQDLNIGKDKVVEPKQKKQIRFRNRNQERQPKIRKKIVSSDSERSSNSEKINNSNHSSIMTMFNSLTKQFQELKKQLGQKQGAPQSQQRGKPIQDKSKKQKKKEILKQERQKIKKMDVNEFKRKQKAIRDEAREKLEKLKRQTEIKLKKISQHKTQTNKSKDKNTSKDQKGKGDWMTMLRNITHYNPGDEKYRQRDKQQISESGARQLLYQQKRSYRKGLEEERREMQREARRLKR